MILKKKWIIHVYSIFSPINGKNNKNRSTTWHSKGMHGTAKEMHGKSKESVPWWNTVMWSVSECCLKPKVSVREHMVWFHMERCGNGDRVDRKSKHPLTGLLLYIIFIQFFYQLSWRSNSAPNVTSFLADYSSTCYTSRIYTYFRFQVFFLMFPTFTCASIHPSTCFHFPFHVLWLCSQPFPSYYDILYFYVLSSLHSRFIPTQYINRCISVVVL